MHADLDTLVVALYVTIDHWSRLWALPPAGAKRRDPAPSAMAGWSLTAASSGRGSRHASTTKPADCSARR